MSKVFKPLLCVFEERDNYRKIFYFLCPNCKKIIYIAFTPLHYTIEYFNYPYKSFIIQETKEKEEQFCIGIQYGIKTEYSSNEIIKSRLEYCLVNNDDM